MATALYKDRIKIDELSAVSFVDKEKDYIETSITSESNKTSYKFKIKNFSSINGKLINDSAKIRYNTDNLELFLNYNQQSTDSRPVVFEHYPFVDNTESNVSSYTNELLTRKNLTNFETYYSKTSWNPKYGILAYNWENEYTTNGTTNPSTTLITNFKNFITKSENCARATYKFPYNSNVTDPISLSGFGENLVVFYTVAGIVSVKSTIKDQKSGTIYLEARENSEKEWITIDSAVFKFANDSNSPGTYITLNGYLSTNFETRLRLNLHPQGYSMNLSEFRQSKYALTNHYVNTFVGFGYCPNYAMTS